MSETNPKHIMVMTGATSGIGAQAVKQFVASPDTLVLTGVLGKGRTVSGAEVFPLDLASLASVRAFADAVKQRLGDAKIEMLVTSLGGQSAVKDLIMTALRPLLRFVSLFLQQLYMNTPEQSGVALAELVLGHVIPPSGRVYASHVRDKITFPDPSKLAQSDEARDRLWRESAIMVGLQVESTEKNAGSPA